MHSEMYGTAARKNLSADGTNRRDACESADN
jgi:hypothetical protein